VELYIYKVGYVIEDQIHGHYPLPNLKYFILGVGHENRLAVELVDLDVVANNLNLPKIVSSVLGHELLRTNEIKRDKLNVIRKLIRNQKLWAIQVSFANCNISVDLVLFN
jgi:hypothetical protein